MYLSYSRIDLVYMLSKGQNVRRSPIRVGTSHDASRASESRASLMTGNALRVSLSKRIVSQDRAEKNILGTP